MDLYVITLTRKWLFHTSRHRPQRTVVEKVRALVEMTFADWPGKFCASEEDSLRSTLVFRA
jgi:hypothetical protein